MVRSVKAGLLGCMLLFSLLPSWAQYPAKPIRVISQFAPGGPGDTLLRSSLDAAGKALGQPLVVDNRPGADGIIAMDLCRRAPADGYTLCFLDSFAVVMAPLVRNVPFDPQKELAPVMHFAHLESLLLVHNSVPATSMQELLALAKARPGTITFSSGGNSSPPHLYIEWMRKELGVNFLEVPYKTSGLAFQALLSGEVQVSSFSTTIAKEHVVSGRLRALASNSLHRVADFPQVPTFREVGIPLHIRTWFGLFAPAGTPSDAITRVNAELARSFFSNPQLADTHLTSRGFSRDAPVGEPAAAFAAFLQQQNSVYGEMAKIAGLKRE